MPELTNLERMKNNILFAIKLKDKMCLNIAVETYRESGEQYQEIDDLIALTESMNFDEISDKVLECKVDALESGGVCENCSS